MTINGHNKKGRRDWTIKQQSTQIKKTKTKLPYSLKFRKKNTQVMLILIIFPTHEIIPWWYIRGNNR